MKNFTIMGVFVLFAQMMFSPIIAAQEIQGNRLISWSSAKGDIIIPDEVTEIAENCFYTPPEDVDNDWGGGDAESNLNITSVDFNNVIIIGKNAFRGCTGITSIKAGKVATIGDDAFKECNALKKVELYSITNLGKHSFAYCNALEEVILGKSLTTVGENPFTNCLNLSSLSIESNAPDFRTENNALIRIADGVLISVAGATKELIIGGICKEVGSSALFGCSQLIKLELPEVIKLGDKSLVNCSSLAELLVPKLEIVDNSSFITMQGVGNLKVVDIHLSPDFKGFNDALADNVSTTIYVANEIVKSALETKFNKTKIIVGAPTAVQPVTISYSCNSNGSLEVWTTGAVDVVSGQTLSYGSKVTFKAIPHFDYEVESWTLNGNDITNSVKNNTYVIESVQDNVNIIVKFRKRSDGYYVFFRSLSPSFGSISCSTSDGTEVKYGDKIPTSSILTFTAKPTKGFRITEWSQDKGTGNKTEFVVIPGQTGKNTYTCQAEDGLDIAVDFDRIQDYFIVKFRSYNTNTGILTATLEDGTEITSGEAFPKGSKIIFTVQPIGTNTVDEWHYNGETIIGYKERIYTIENLSSDIEIGVVCSIPVGSDINPVIKDGHLISWKPIGAAVLPTEVTHIDTEAFKGANEMTSLTLNENLQYISERAFLYASEITHFEVPTGNQNFVAIDGVLYNKEKTLLVAYPAGRTSSTYEIIASAQGIVPGCFITCPRLSGVTVANTNTSLKAVDGALYTSDNKILLYYPTSMQTGISSEITLPEGIKTVGRLALAYYPVVKKIILPGTLTNIEARAFSYNFSLSSIEFAEGVTPQVEIIGDSALYYNRSLITLPYMPKLKNIGVGALGINSVVEEIHIASGCAIGKKAFEGCQNIKRIYAYDKTPTIIEADAFSSIVYINEAKLYVPLGAKQAYATATGWKIFGNNIIEDTALSTTQTLVEQLIIRCSAEGFIIEGLKQGLRYSLYSIDGKSIKQGTTKGNTLFIQKSIHDRIVILKIEGMSVVKLVY